MSKSISEENLSIALKFIVDNFGKQTLLDANKVKSILSDIVPKLSKESKWVKEAIELGITKILLNDKNYNHSNKKLLFNKAKQMMEEERISEERINFVLYSFLYALGWTNNKVANIDEMKMENKKSNSKNIIEKYTFEKVNNKKKEPPSDNTSLKKHIEKNIPNNLNSNNQMNQNQINPNNQTNQNQSDVNKPDSSNINNSKLKKYKFIISLAIVIILVFVGSIVSKNLVGNDVYTKEITFDVPYEKEGNKYIFKKDDFILMDIDLSGSKPDRIDESKLTYDVEDTSVCTITNEFNKCRIRGMREGSTVIHIYYDKKEIELVNLEFTDVEEEEINIKEISFSTDYTVKDGVYTFNTNEPIDINVNLENDSTSPIDLSKIDFEVKDSEICEISSFNESCQILGINPGQTLLTIKYDKEILKTIPISFEVIDNEIQEYNELESNSAVDLVGKSYWENYAKAVNYGDISYLSDFLTHDGYFYNELVKSLPKRYEKGMKINALSYKKEKMVLEGNSYRVGYTLEYYIEKPEGEIYQVEYMEFIIVPCGSEWLIDTYENWKLLEQRAY